MLPLSGKTKLVGKAVIWIYCPGKKVVPEWIWEDKKGNKWTEKEGLDALMEEAIKELKTENDTLRKKNQHCLEKFNQIQLRIAASDIKKTYLQLDSDILNKENEKYTDNFDGTITDSEKNLV